MARRESFPKRYFFAPGLSRCCRNIYLCTRDLNLAWQKEIWERSLIFPVDLPRIFSTFGPAKPSCLVDVHPALSAWHSLELGSSTFIKSWPRFRQPEKRRRFFPSPPPSPKNKKLGGKLFLQRRIGSFPVRIPPPSPQLGLTDGRCRNKLAIQSRAGHFRYF